MANHRDLAKELFASSLGHTSASRIWRTVVFAGAMLAAPLASTGCGGKSKPAENTTTTQQSDTTNADQAAQDKAAADKAAADKAAADQAAADKAAADAEQAKKDEEAKAAQAQADKEAADKAAAEEAASKKRPRGGNSRPTGRGFVLA